MPCHLPDRMGPGDRLKVEFDWGTEFHGTFDEWVEQIFNGQALDPYLCDNHVRPQADFIGRDAKVFLFENGLKQVFDWIDTSTNTHRTLVKLDRNASSPFAIDMLGETREMIMSFYREDFDTIKRIHAN